MLVQTVRIRTSEKNNLKSPRYPNERYQSLQSAGNRPLEV